MQAMVHPQKKPMFSPAIQPGIQPAGVKAWPDTPFLPDALPAISRMPAVEGSLSPEIWIG